MSLAEQMLFRSSANNRNVMNLNTSHVSLIYRRKTYRPNIQPYGTPHVMLFSMSEL